MEAMYRARKGEYVLYEMRHRSRMQQMAKVYTVDMREELKNGNHTILSGKLQSLMEERLERGEQIILFFEPAWIFGICVLQGMWTCDPVSTLQCIPFRS